MIIAGAGGAAHLPGMVASMTPLPVLGVPVESQALKGIDSLLSIVQMPAGVPVGTLAIGEAGAVNAALLAAADPGARRQAPRQARWRPGAQRQHRRGRRDERPMTTRDEAAGADAAGIAPGATIGILGGGQLGRMTALAAAPPRLSLPHLLPARPTVAGRRRSPPRATIAAYDDEAALGALRGRGRCRHLRIRERAGGARPSSLAGDASRSRPGPQVLHIAQHRLREKDFLALDRRRRPRAIARSPMPASLDARGRAIGLPAVLKTRALRL